MLWAKDSFCKVFEEHLVALVRFLLNYLLLPEKADY
jgi:hypothetical protein